jgi:hypothetical protein
VIDDRAIRFAARNVDRGVGARDRQRRFGELAVVELEIRCGEQREHEHD